MTSKWPTNKTCAVLASTLDHTHAADVPSWRMLLIFITNIQLKDSSELQIIAKDQLLQNN